MSTVRATRAKKGSVVKVSSLSPLSRHAQRPTVEGVGDDVGAADLARRVADSVKRLRAEREMSLDQLAAVSGVSRAALSQIEGARTNPTLGVLWKVASGLNVAFQTLLGPTETSSSKVVRAGDAIPLRSADGRMESRLLSLAGSADRIETYELRFQPKGIHQSEPHDPSAEESVIVLTGALRVIVGEEEFELRAGDTLRFVADVRHSYENRSSGETRCVNVVSYGRA